MAIETERKFIMRRDWFDAEVMSPEALAKGLRIQQCYLPTNAPLAARIRIVNDNEAWLTLKGKKTSGSGSEYEFPLDVPDAKAMIAEFCIGGLKKMRFAYDFEGRLYDVDVFTFGLNVLVLAELEGDDSIHTVQVPHWATQEVTEDHRYSNLSLALNGDPSDIPVFEV